MSRELVQKPWLEVYRCFDPLQPAGDPQHEEFVRIDRPYSPTGEIETGLRFPTGFRRDLLIGAAGSGKTTELLSLLRRPWRLRAVLVDIRQHFQDQRGDVTALDRLHPWEVLTVVAFAIFRYGEELGHTWDDGVVKQRRDAVAGPDAALALRLDIPALAKEVALLIATASSPAVATALRAVAAVSGSVSGTLPLGVRPAGETLRSDQDASVRALRNAANAMLGELQRAVEGPPIVVLVEAARARMALGAPDAAMALVGHGSAARFGGFGATTGASADDLVRSALAFERPSSAETGLDAIHQAAVALGARGDLDGSRKVLDAVVGVSRRRYGANHQRTLTAIWNLAETLRVMGQSAEARSLHAEALAGRETKLGTSHPDVADSQLGLAGALFELGMRNEALALLHDALALYRRLLGPEHPMTLRAQGFLGHLLRGSGDSQRARALHERTLAASQRALGPEHPSTLASANNLAAVLVDLGELTAALAMYRDILDARIRTRGHATPSRRSRRGISGRRPGALGSLRLRHVFTFWKHWRAGTNRRSQTRTSESSASATSPPTNATPDQQRRGRDPAPGALLSPSQRRQTQRPKRVHAKA